MSATAKQVMDMQSACGVTPALNDEHQRRWTQEQWERHPGNYDYSRRHLNFEIVNGKIMPLGSSPSIHKRMAARFAELGIKDPNKGQPKQQRRTAEMMVIHGSRERMLELAFGDQKVNFDRGADNSHLVRHPDIERWSLDIYRFICDQFGEDNIVGFNVHLDETNPHIHCVIMPITPDGKLSYKKVFNGQTIQSYRLKMKQLHDALAKVNEPWGLVRGDSIAETGAKHKSTEQYRRELHQQNAELERKIAAGELTLAELNEQIRVAERRVKGLTTMVENLFQQQSQLTEDIHRLEHEAVTNLDDRDRILRELDAKRRDLTDVEAKLADKNQKLGQANHILAQLQEQIDDKSEQYKQVQRLIDEATSDMVSDVRNNLLSVGFSDVIKEFSQLFGRMNSSHDTALFEDSLMNEIATRGNYIIACASLLFMGYVDQAVQFAETHGGGGGNNDLPRRRDDEDRQSFARRCFHAARSMTKSSVTRNRKI